MTIIAYKHDQQSFAWDSRSTTDGLICSDDSDKLHLVPNAGLLCGGSLQGIRTLIDCWNGKKIEPYSENQYAVGFAVTIDSEVYRIGFNESGFWKENITFDWAVGSAYWFAIAAMDFGKDSVGAVEYTVTRDIYSGGKIHSATVSRIVDSIKKFGEK